MKKTKTNAIENKENRAVFKKTLKTLCMVSLIYPLLIKIFLDIPMGVADYLCNSYSLLYPTAATAGVIMIQVLAVVAEILRVGLIGCVLCVLLYLAGKKAERKVMVPAVMLALLSPPVISAVGMGLNYFCVANGISRVSPYQFKGEFLQYLTAALIEYAQYVVIVVGAFLVLYLFSTAKGTGSALFAQSKGFFPASYLFRAVTVSVCMFGVLSLVLKVSDMLVDMGQYDVTADFAAVIGYLVLPYLYLVLDLFAMLIFAAILYRSLERRWEETA